MHPWCTLLALAAMASSAGVDAGRNRLGGPLNPLLGTARQKKPWGSGGKNKKLSTAVTTWTAQPRTKRAKRVAVAANATAANAAAAAAAELRTAPVDPKVIEKETKNEPLLFKNLS
jgi:hypothetical protein